MLKRKLTCYVILGHSIYQENPAGGKVSNNRETNIIYSEIKLCKIIYQTKSCFQTSIFLKINLAIYV